MDKGAFRTQKDSVVKRAPAYLIVRSTIDTLTVYWIFEQLAENVNNILHFLLF